MSETLSSRDDWIRQQVERFTNRTLSRRPRVVQDTTSFMSIDRDDVIELAGRFYLVRCNEKEGRFGLDDEPKFWVKRVIALDSGRTQILKLVFHEEFKVRIGPMQIRCVRSEEKEGRVLEVGRGDERLMQGRTVRDIRGNLVRVIDYIRGRDLITHVDSLSLAHEEYFQSAFPPILARVIDCFGAIHRLHEQGLCHGDIRNDHILVDRETGRYRWIDFDLTQDFSDYDVWSLGNVLHFVVAKRFVSFRQALREQPDLVGRLNDDDASVLFPHRVMHLGKVMAYLPPRLVDILLRFSVGTRIYYDSVGQLVEDLGDCASGQGWPTAIPDPPAAGQDSRQVSGAA